MLIYKEVIFMDYPIMKIPAKAIEETDWVEGEGAVAEVSHYSTLTWLRCHGQADGKLIPRLNPVWVRLEDHGLDSEGGTPA